MQKPTAEEKRILTTFFRCAAPHYGLFDRGTLELAKGAISNGIFQKNLESLREIRKDVKIPASLLEDACRFCIRDKVQVNWINEVPGIVDEVLGINRNLMSGNDTYLHRLLRRVEMPATRLEFGAAYLSTPEGPEPTITHVERFTMLDLINHFVDTFGIYYSEPLERAFAGSFKYLLSAYGLDAVLLAIDAAEIAEMRITKPLDLDSCMTLAVEEVRHRKMRLEAAA